MASPGLARTAVLTALTLTAFAGNSILCRLALRGGAIDPASFTALRLASGALILLPFLVGKRKAGGWSIGAAVALFAYALGFSLAYVTLDTGTGALLLFGLVQATMIGSGLRQGERLSALGTVGFAVAVIGVVTLVLPGVSAPDPRGAILMAIAGLAWGAYSLLGRGVPAPTVATARNFLAAAPLGLAALVPFASSLSITPGGVALAVASGAITSGLGYVLWYTTLRGHSATSAAIVQLAVPVLAALGGSALLGEEPTARLVVAGILTLGGVGLALWTRRAS